MDGKKKKTNVAKTKTVTLENPIEWGEETVSEVKIGPLKGRHIKNVGSNMKLGDLFSIAASASDYPKSFYEDLDATDANKVADAIADLL